MLSFIYFSTTNALKTLTNKIIHSKAQVALGVVKNMNDALLHDLKASSFDASPKP